MFEDLIVLLQQHAATEEVASLEAHVHELWSTLGGNPEKMGTMSVEIVLSNADALGLEKEAIQAQLRKRFPGAQHVTFAGFHSLVIQGVLRNMHGETGKSRRDSIASTVFSRRLSSTLTFTNGHQADEFCNTLELDSDSDLDDVVMAPTISSTAGVAAAAPAQGNAGMAAAALMGLKKRGLRRKKRENSADGYLSTVVADRFGSLMDKHGDNIDNLRQESQTRKPTPYMMHSRIFLRPLQNERNPNRQYVIQSSNNASQTYGKKPISRPGDEVPRFFSKDFGSVRPEAEDEHFNASFLRRFLIRKIAVRARADSPYSQLSLSDPTAMSYAT